MRFGPGCVEERVLSIEPGGEAKLTGYAPGKGRKNAYHLSATIPFAVRPRMYNLPFPTSPKFAEAATAIRESKKGEYLTL